MKHSELQRWMHPAVILVAMDLRDNQRLMALALQQARETGARLILFHVVASEVSFPNEAMGFPFYDLSGAMRQARAVLLPLCQAARAQKIRCDVVVREGNPAMQILDAVRQFHVCRILLGTRNRGRFSKLLLGSVADQVLRSVQIPVMTVGPEAYLEMATDNQKRVVLLATNLRETSRTGAALACRIARARKARLVILYVLPDSAKRSSDEINALRELNVLASSICENCEGEEPASCTDVEVSVTHGHPCERILEVAEDLHVELIILGTMRPAAMRHLTNDHTLHKVLTHAPCPVLTLCNAATVAEQTKDRELQHAG
ncbi:MAG: universal stress protein [Acidobacteriota bacterium]|nr:universal stress protein [Acidobacteriota bacterium]